MYANTLNHERKESMLSRIVYAIKAFWCNRTQLKQYAAARDLQLASIVNLTPQNLTDRGIEALVLDFDGVLAAHAELRPRADVVQWLNTFAQEFAPHKIYILSNKPTAERQAYFKQNFPDITFIVAKRMKPYPDGLQQILLTSGLLPNQLLLVDDRLGTGILATIISGIQGYWITQSITNFYARPLRETWFMLLRHIERLACKII